MIRARLIKKVVNNSIDMKKHTAKKAKRSAPAKKGKKGMSALAGGLIGAALGVGAGLLVESNLGKKIGKEAKHLSSDFYAFMVPQIKKVKKMGEEEYKKFVEEAMARYGKDKKLSEAEAKRLVREAQGSWKHLKKHL